MSRTDPVLAVDDEEAAADDLNGTGSLLLRARSVCVGDDDDWKRGGEAAILQEFSV